MTSLQVAQDGFLKRDNLQAEDDIFYLYGSTAAHITEETEYVRKIRTTLEKIQSQLFKDEVNDVSPNSKQEKNSSNIQQNGCHDDDETSFGSRYKKIIEKLADQDLQLVEIDKENNDLQIKLEATREAGSDAIRNAARRLYENYDKQSEQLRKNHEEEKQKIQESTAENQGNFKQSVEKLHEVAEKIEEKHGRIIELENLMQRMEAEKTTLLNKKRSFEDEILRRMSNHGNKNGCVGLQMEVSTLQEQINHLQFLMMSQHQSLRSLIQETEELKNRLKEQDLTIEDLQDRVNFLEDQNKELKDKVGHLSYSPVKVSKGVAVSEFMLDNLSPYFMLRNRRNKNTTEKS
ncbi:coiled-coil domain-containing protein 68 isoform 1-T2 [Discoglossus pictus]